MAFGITKDELENWKRNVKNNRLSFLTHYWIDERFPTCNSVTKAGCGDLDELIRWGEQHGLLTQWIDNRSDYPHFDLFGGRQLSILQKEGQWEQIKRFKLDK
ncbi:hypothetical protein [Pseudalkalibacillus decolorationis]|uniref:hypothetical protein n=1 Tax=Pseudalkalibacillus decolorationis TaxID=163879 RepID=UPI0021492340|nr:hypothetical protein [Pseudalkalibacillus decolorationis]